MSLVHPDQPTLRASPDPPGLMPPLFLLPPPSQASAAASSPPLRNLFVLKNHKAGVPGKEQEAAEGRDQVNGRRLP